MLYIVLPLSNVFVSIWEEHRPLAISFTCLEVTFIHASIGEGQLAFPIEQVIHELSLVRAFTLSEIVHS